MTWREFRAAQKQIALDGLAHVPLRVAYAEAGEGDPVLLLHGIPTWGYLWREILPPLARSRRVIAPDFLGHGFSDRRDCFDRSLVSQTEMVLQLLDALGLDQVDVVGHDTGGGVALILAIEHPRVLSRLVLSNAVCYDSWPAAEMLQLGDPGLKAQPAAELLDRVREGVADGIFREERRTPEFEEGILAPYADEEGKVSLIRNAISLNTNHTTMLVDRLGGIAAEVLLLWGAEDPWQTLADAHRLGRDIPNARLQPIARASHWLQQDAPDEVAAAIEGFLSL